MRWSCHGACRPQACHDLRMGDIREYLRNNPQALVLLIITVVLGLGTFIAVLIALVSSGSTTGTGEPNDAVTLLRAVVLQLHL